MYKYTRQEVADLLKMSSRSVDRYVKSGKLRAKKEGKIVYINKEDVDNLRGGKKKQEVLTAKKPKVESVLTEPTKQAEQQNESIVQEISITKEDFNTGNENLDAIYTDLKREIKERDNFIAELSNKLGKAEEIVKNSVALIDYKKSQFLLEESKSNLNQAIIDLESDKEDLEKQVKYQKVNNSILLMALVFVFGIAFALFWLNM